MKADVFCLRLIFCLLAIFANISEAKTKRSTRTATEEVNLNDLQTPAAPTIEAPSPITAPATSGAPVFKAYFDTIFSLRPGVSPLSFDSYHSVFLIDYIPNPSIKFSTELPTFSGVQFHSRFFELNWTVTEKLILRVGKIWIPFDRADPHQSFGGITNTSYLRTSPQTAFLPDLWADLGVGVKFQLLDAPDAQIVTHGYIVNGFGGTTYPSFDTPATGADINHDKAMGARVHMLLGHFFGLGASAYIGRWTPQASAFGNLMMFGIDTQFTLPSKTELRGGYAYMNVEIPTATPVGSAERGAWYVEGEQKLSRYFRVLVRGGGTQNDSRVSNEDDRFFIGAKITYMFNPMIHLSIERHQDLNHRVSGEFTALRLVMMF